MKKTTILLLLILCFSLLPTASSAAEASTYEDYAECLSDLNVFVGTGNGFELDRAPTRIEGLVMLIRLLGAEDEAKSKQANALPFTDVPNWASGYVAYAYENGLTNGIGKTKFGSADKMDAKAYMTFLLRSLGYNDQAGDFSYNNSLIFAESIRLINDTTYATLEGKPFIRAYIAKTSYDALKFPYKGGDILLIDKLMAENRIDKATGEAFKKTALSEPVESGLRAAAPIDMESTLESVVMLSCYTEDTDEETGPDIGSGVILSPDGRIVTNYHVIEGADDIDVTFNDGSVYKGDVFVMDYDEELDLAVLKIDKTGLRPAVIGTSGSVRTGDAVVTIGSPFGLINTVTEGIVSAIRTDSIQISAAVNPGNSGGGLFDRNGKLIGIPSSMIFLAENVGFAIPVDQLSEVSGNMNILLKDFKPVSTETLPAAPTGLRLVYETKTTAMINWDPVAGAQYYNVYFKEEEDVDYWYDAVAYYGPNYSYLEIELTPGEKYSFKVTAQIDDQESEMSPALTFVKSPEIRQAGSFNLFYTENPEIPDFGKLAGISPSSRAAGEYHYSLKNNDASLIMLIDYGCLLEDCGFAFYGSGVTDAGIPADLYMSGNYNHMIAVIWDEKTNNTVELSVLIEDSNKQSSNNKAPN